MYEITIVEVSPQPVLGMRKKGFYREIPVMLSRIYNFALSRSIQVAGYPIFLWHETTIEEAQKADKEGNADIEVAVPVSEIVEIIDEEEISGY